MAEAEEVISDAARHATVFVQKLWQRHRAPSNAPKKVDLSEMAPRIDLLLTAVFGTCFRIRSAQPPAHPTFLSQVFHRGRGPVLELAIPATDGVSVWLPAELPDAIGLLSATAHYRTAALQQAMRATRGSAGVSDGVLDPLLTDVYLLLEAYAADQNLIAMLPGIAEPLIALRRECLAMRPALSSFPPYRRPLEMFLRDILQTTCGEPLANVPISDSPEQSLADARRLINQLGLFSSDTPERLRKVSPLLKDWWTGELRPPPSGQRTTVPAGVPDEQDSSSTRSAHMMRRPEEREAKEGEDDEGGSGVWMVQIDEPHQHAEDPMGLQRPTDKDVTTSAEEFGDLVSELPQARLVSTPGRPKEVLLTDDPPDAPARQALSGPQAGAAGIQYPEWDYRAQAYRTPGATVRRLAAPPGSQQWVDKTLAEHQSMLHSIRRRFEMLRSQRAWQRKRLDGDEIDLDAYTDSYADFRSGGRMAEALYQTRRPVDRSMAITLLIDVSGSTDSWISTNRRVIDVEREALLLVCFALEGIGEAFSVAAFSGEGPGAVTVRHLKSFDEPYSNDVALRISALEPEHYTRAGAAIRDASAALMHQPAAHRLLLLLSDGKPNDVDNYEGRYGVEDMRQAVVEAKLQGIFPFCLTIDRQASNYLPRIFGANQYALLPKPALLPEVLLDWMKRLLAR